MKYCLFLLSFFLFLLTACNNNELAPGPPTEDIVKQKISEQVIGYDKQNIEVDFNEIKIGKPRKATQYDDWSRGLEGQLIYPVRVTYVINTRYNNGTTELKDMNYLFGKEEGGEWTFTQR